MKSIAIAIASMFAASVAFAQAPAKKEEAKPAAAAPAKKEEAKPAAPAKKDEKKEAKKDDKKDAKK